MDFNKSYLRRDLVVTSEEKITQKRVILVDGRQWAVGCNTIRTMKIRYIPSVDERNLPFNDYIKNNYPQFLHEAHPDIFLVIGGDGAMLHAIQKYNNSKTPFFGINGGTLNFLMNVVTNRTKFITDALENKIKFHEVETTSIKVTLEKNKTKKILGYAVNEVVVGSTIMGYHNLCISTKDESFIDFNIKGGGIGVSTDLGSTGFNFNLGGSVLPLGSKIWSINGIVINRFLNDIIPIQKLEIKVLENRKPPLVFLDGINQKLELKEKDKIILEKGNKIKLAFLEKGEFLKKRFEIAGRYRN